MSKARTIAVDTETTGLDIHHGCKPFIISTCDDDLKERVWEWDVNPKTREPKISDKSRREFGRHIQGSRVVFHNGPYDLAILANANIFILFPEKIWPAAYSTDKWRRHSSESKPVFVECPDFEETQLASAICCSSDSYALKDLCYKYLNVRDTDQKALKEAVKACNYEAAKLGFKQGYDPQGVRQSDYDYWIPKALDPKNKLARTYAIKDVKDRTIKLWFLYESIIEDEECLQKSYQEEKELLPILYAMEANGMTMDNRRTRKLSQLMKKRNYHYKLLCKKVGDEILQREDFNPNSDKQLCELLYGWSLRPNGVNKVKRHFHLPAINVSDKGNPSVSADTIGSLLNAAFKQRHESNRNKLAARYLVSHLQFSKDETGIGYLKSYVARALPTKNKQQSVLHFGLNQTGTKLTRLSSSKPNMQNVTDKARIPLRSVFSPPPGFEWYSIDYSQLELRILAYASQDKKLIKAYESGIDLHDLVLQELKWPEHRRRDAKAVNFRITYGGGGELIDAIGGPGTYARMASRFPRLFDYKDEMIRFSKKHGFVYTMSGRRLYVESARAATTAVNAVVQGTAGEIIKFAMRRICQKKLVDWKTSRIMLQVHDELLTEHKKGTPFKVIRSICDEMEAAGEEVGAVTPVEVAIIKDHWCKKVKLDRQTGKVVKKKSKAA